MFEILTMQEVAKDLKKSKRAVLRMVKSGKLPVMTKARGNNFTYVISQEEYYKWKMASHNERKVSDFLSSRELISKEVNKWIQWLEKGLLTGKPLADKTIYDYEWYLEYYLDNIPRRYRTEAYITVSNLREVLADIDPQSYSKKDHIYKAVRSFVKYLIANKLVKKDLLDELTECKPKRVYPPKKLHCSVEQFETLLKEAKKHHFGQRQYDVILNQTLIAILGYAGLRSSEVCNLRLLDVDLENRKLFVYLGKGKKNRYVGISKKLYKYLKTYLKKRPKSNLEYFFLTQARGSDISVQLETKVLYRKVKRLAEYVDFEINIHGLRRTFATIAANSGKPINIVSLALGHADIKTTQGYLMTNEEEVINEMKGW